MWSTTFIEVQGILDNPDTSFASHGTATAPATDWRARAARDKRHECGDLTSAREALLLPMELRASSTTHKCRAGQPPDVRVITVKMVQTP